jgi:hypothetical protein
MKKGSSIIPNFRIADEILEYLSSKSQSDKKGIALNLKSFSDCAPRIFRATMKWALSRKRDFNTINKAIERIS